MAQTYRIDGVEKALNDAIADYRKGAGEACNRAVEQTMKESAQVIRENVHFRQRSGRYVKSFAVKVTEDKEHKKKMIWYVKAPEYRLTHWLENGHEIRDPNGVSHGDTHKYPHISKGAEYAEKRLPELIKKEMESL